MPFRASFDCLWCGRAHRTRTGEDLEGWAGLCPDCVGRAGDNGFLRFRLRAAIEERSRAARAPVAATVERRPSAPASVEVDLDAEMQAYYAARAPEYDDVYLHRGTQSGGPVLDLWFDRELDEATQWLDRIPWRGEIVELAAGTGWWSPMLAEKGELSIYDINPEPLDVARGRLLAHGLRAHLHVRDAWEEPDRQVDGVFCGFWLSHVQRHRLEAFLGLVHRWLKPSGVFAFIDERPPADGVGSLGPNPSDASAEISVRTLDDGREFRFPKAYHTAERLDGALRAAGFREPVLHMTERFFLMGTAQR
jgi:SAM-dependent methyltransferase